MGSKLHQISDREIDRGKDKEIDRGRDRESECSNRVIFFSLVGLNTKLLCQF